MYKNGNRQDATSKTIYNNIQTEVKLSSSGLVSSILFLERLGVSQGAVSFGSFKNVRKPTLSYRTE